MRYAPVRAPNPRIQLHFLILPQIRNCSGTDWIRNGIVSQSITRRRSYRLSIKLGTAKRGAGQNQIGSGVILSSDPMNHADEM